MHRQTFARSSVAATLVLTFVVVGQVIHSWDNGFRGPLSVSIIGSAVTTFFWFLADPEARRSERAMRKAIAGSMVVGYLVLVGNAAFWQGDERLGALADTMIASFTALLGLVVASYFGASAYVDGKDGGKP